MFKIIRSILAFPFELFITLLGYGIFMCFYLQIVLVPTVLFALTSAFSLGYTDYDTAVNIIYGSSFIGALIGIFWAERIRKKYSIFGFHGYLINHPEIDGWQQSSKGIVFRNGNLTSN